MFYNFLFYCLTCYLNSKFIHPFIYLLLISNKICLTQKVEILMPNVTTANEDAYMCTAYKIQDDQEYLINIEPLAQMNIAHHMFAFGCNKPATSLKAWNCESQVCASEKSILFAWGRNAPTLTLPDNVAFQVGPKTKYKYIVVNIHYLIKVNKDQSGLALTFTNKPRQYTAGIMLMVTGYIDLPPLTKKYTTNISCRYKGATINAFAYRVHSHYHGDVNAAYRVRNHEWKQVAKGDPQWPQAFYKIQNEIDIKDGDYLVGRCTYHNDENRFVSAGATHRDEMCNVYIMYYTDAGSEDVMSTCANDNFPTLSKETPSEAELKPPPIITTSNNNNENLEHHDMGGKIHSNDPKDSYNKQFVSKYTIINDWYDTNSIKFGQIGGIALDPGRSNIVIFHRGSQKWLPDSFNEEFHFNTRKYPPIAEDTIVVLNSNTGKFVKSWGANMFYMPHGISIDPMGNIWVTDVGRHQVFKFQYNKTEEPILEVGEMNIPNNDRKHFCQPTSVAVLKNGEFFVADGYCNSRIVRFDKNGYFLMEFASEEEGLPGHFSLPHSLALHEAGSLLCVADRENYRVQCFDLEGNFLHQSKSSEFGPLYGVAFARNNDSVLYALNGHAYAEEDTQYEKKVFIIQISTGNVIGSISIDQDKASQPHSLTVSNDASEIYIGTLDPINVLKYALLNYDVRIKLNKSSIKSTTIPQKSNNYDQDKENFRTSMFIMAFLAIPLIVVVIVAIFVRLRNMGKLHNLNNRIQKDSEIGKWIKSKSSSKNRNGFTRLNQDSDNEADRLEDSGSDSDEITVPLSKA